MINTSDWCQKSWQPMGLEWVDPDVCKRTASFIQALQIHVQKLQQSVNERHILRQRQGVEHGLPPFASPMPCTHPCSGPASQNPDAAEMR